MHQWCRRDAESRPTWSQIRSHFFSLSYWLRIFTLSGGRFIVFWRQKWRKRLCKKSDSVKLQLTEQFTFFGVFRKQHILQEEIGTCVSKHFVSVIHPNLLFDTFITLVCGLHWYLIVEHLWVIRPVSKGAGWGRIFFQTQLGKLFVTLYFYYFLQIFGIFLSIFFFFYKK